MFSILPHDMHLFLPNWLPTPFTTSDPPPVIPARRPLPTIAFTLSAYFSPS